MNNIYVQKNKLLIATHNSAKLEEIKRLLEGAPFECVSLAELGIEYDVDETGTTYEENAVLKAKTYCALSGLPTLGDDSGMEIDVLHGEPGIYTKRYFGNQLNEQEKREKLLRVMAHVPVNERTAQFICVMALAYPNGKIETYRGVMHGAIATTIRGTAVPLFPYWSIFEHADTKKTCSELLDEGKESASHRAAAIEQVIKNIRLLQD